MPAGLSSFQPVPFMGAEGEGHCVLRDSEAVAGGWGGGAALAPGGGLPCLSRNNCDNPTVSLTGYQKKRADSVQINVAKFVALYGVENCAFLTLTFDPKSYPGGLEARDALKRFHNLCRRVFPELFGEWIRILEFQANGMPHFHLLVQCHGDVRTGFNWAHYDATVKWSKGGRKGPKPAGNLGRTELLKEIHDRLREWLPSYGFGRAELVPVRKPDGVGFYMGGYMAKSLANRPESAKGTRFVGYSAGFDRTVKGGFSWAGNHALGRAAWLWRAKARSWAFSNGCLTLEDVRGTFGDKWAYWSRKAIMEFPLTYWPTDGHMRLDKTAPSFCVPPESTEIFVEGRRAWDLESLKSLPPLEARQPTGRKYELKAPSVSPERAKFRVLKALGLAREGQAELRL